jgi:error-prone DNA polymerase
MPEPGQSTEPTAAAVIKSAPDGSSYAELHCHSNFSFLDGTSDPEALIERAIELGLSALALTDSHGLYGIVRFAAAAEARRRRGELSIQVIVGAELLLTHGERIVLLVQDLTGYRNLCWLLDRAHRHALPVGSRRGSFEPQVALADLADRTDGLIALVRPAPAAEDALAARLREYQRFIPNDALYVEITRHLVPGEERHNARLRRAADVCGLRTVATNAVHYATKDRALLHDVVTSIRLRVPLEQAAQPDGASPPLLFPNDERCLKSPEEMAQLFRGHEQELATTLEIARRCTFGLADLTYEFPLPDNIPEGRDAYDVLVEAVWHGARTYYPQVTRELHDRIVHELEIVKQLQLPGYLLVFKDVVDFCHQERILVSIRGSAPASVLLYCLGLCPIDPLEHKLLFERFASEERGEYPDIDLDIAHEDRERVIQYVYEKYGRARVAMVCEVNTYRARSAVRDVAFALGLPRHQIDALAKTVDLYDRRSLDSLLETGGSSLPVDGRVAALLISLCQQLVGAPRHLSIHVGGMVISARPLHEVVHNQPARMPGRTIIPWDKDDIAILAELFEVNLIKMDLLGLGMLKVVSRVFEQLEARGEERPKLHGFRYDERIFDVICKGDTIGLFQIESRAQISFLPRLKPRNLHDVAISVGAIRPGPGATGAGSRIARRRNGLEPITYPHPSLEDALKQTSGVLLWQEQVMQVATIMAGYKLGEAEQLRRAMTHKRSYEAMEALCDDLVQRMLALGHDKGLAEEIRRMIVGFAGYGFPRAHAYPFAHLALVSATLKLLYPAEYLAAILNSQPMGFYAPHTLIWDAARHGVRVLPVDVNVSTWECTLEERDALRLGFNMVRGLGPHARTVLERERANGPYRSLADFVRRTGLDRDAVERLAEVGAFLRFDERRAAIWRAGELAGLSSPNHLPGLADQLAERADLPPMDAWESTRADYGGLGLSVDRHLVSFYRPRLRLYDVRSAAELEHRRGGPVRIGGIVICRQRPETANDFMFMTLEDETGLVNVIVQPQVYHALTRALRGEPLLVIEGILQRDGIVVDVIARKAWPFSALESGGNCDSHSDMRVGFNGPSVRSAPRVPSHDFR